MLRYTITAQRCTYATTFVAAKLGIGAARATTLDARRDPTAGSVGGFGRLMLGLADGQCVDQDAAVAFVTARRNVTAGRTVPGRQID